MTELNRRAFLASSASAVTGLAILPELAIAARPYRAAEPLNVALVGVGRQGRAILAELAKIENVKLAALCDSDPQRLEAGLRRAGGDAAAGATSLAGFADHRELLDRRKDITAIIVATPTHLHRQIVLDALQAGKHVYCEAPMASTIDDAKSIAAAARASKTVMAVGLEARSNPVYQLARTFFRSDSVRDLISMRAQHHQKTSWRVPASDPAREKAFNWRLDPAVSLGLAGEWGVQQFDVFHWYRDQYPVAVRGHGGVRFHKDGREIADTVQLALEFADGAQLDYSATLANSYDGRYEVLNGSNAAIKLAWSHGWMFKEADAPTQGWEVYANRQQFHNDQGITLIADATKLASQGKLKEGVGLPYPPTYYAIADFIKSVSESKPAVASADAGLRATVVGIAASQAARSGATVKIDPAVMKGA